MKTLLNSFLDLLEQWGRLVLIKNRTADSLYLMRYVILRTKWISIYIHRFMDSDHEVPHDHPWACISLALRGTMREVIWDVEDQKESSRFVKPGSLIYRPIRHCHKLQVKGVLPYEKREDAPMTLFITGPRVKPWGFVEKDNWTLWTSYLGLNEKQIKEIYGTEANNV